MEKLIPVQKDHVRRGYDLPGIIAKLMESGFENIRITSTFGEYGIKAWLLSKFTDSVLTLPLRPFLYTCIGKMVRMEMDHPPGYGRGRGIFIMASRPATG